MPANPGAAARAAQALMRDPARRNTAIAIEAGCGYDTIARLRARLEQCGLIEPASLPYPTRNQGAYQRARAELRRSPARSLRQIAQAASCAHPTVIRARRGLERAAAQRAQAGWQSLSKRQPLVPCQPTSYAGLEFPRGWLAESGAAVRLCTRYCPALAACRQYALAHPELPGMLGGLTRRERQRAR